MTDDSPIARYRKLYARLLRLYPRPYRERFAEGMEQTFHDLCRERREAGAGLGRFALGAFAETATGIVREHGRSVGLRAGNVLRIAVATAVLLSVPLFAMQFTSEANWDTFDFLVAGCLIFGAGLAFDLVSRKGGTLAYRLAAGVAIATAFLLVWINAAVGVIGNEDLANAFYVGCPLAVGSIGALTARFLPLGMSRALWATAATQLAVPLLATLWIPTIDFSPGVVPVLGLSSVFAAAWIAAALLFRFAAPNRPATVAASTG